MLATGDTQGCYLWDVATGKGLRRIEGRRPEVGHARIRARRQDRGRGERRDTLRLWDTATCAQLRVDRLQARYCVCRGLFA